MRNISSVDKISKSRSQKVATPTARLFECMGIIHSGLLFIMAPVRRIINLHC